MTRPSEGCEANVLCRNGWHRFKPRYDIGVPLSFIKKAEGCTPQDVIDIKKASRPKTWAGDACVRCGKTVTRHG